MAAAMPRQRRQQSRPFVTTSTPDVYDATDSRKAMKRRYSNLVLVLAVGLLGVLGASWRFVVSREPTIPEYTLASPIHLPNTFSNVGEPKHQSMHRHESHDIKVGADVTRRHGLSLEQGQNGKVLTYYLETTTTGTKSVPLPSRKTSAKDLGQVSFSNVTCDKNGFLNNFPVNQYPLEDPFLPWIHDYFVQTSARTSEEAPVVQFVAQNRRRCETGKGKLQVMRYWEPQIALFQPVPVSASVESNSSRCGINNSNNSPMYRLSSSKLEDATAVETRFFCRFHDDISVETMVSQFNIPYEYVNWRKHNGQPMFAETGTSDLQKFEFSQLLFYCVIPERFRDALVVNEALRPKNANVMVWLDIIPIRTPPRRGQWLLSEEHVGKHNWQESSSFNTTYHYGKDHVLPCFDDSGRIANLPLCPSLSPLDQSASTAKTTLTTTTTKRTYHPANVTGTEHRLVVCTWTASSYKRRGDTTKIDDTSLRVQEWIVFHKLVGVDHIYLYDNTQEQLVTKAAPSLQAIAAKFPDFVTYVPWPATVCSNNRPNHKNPGERSSQYAAEASCLERYGISTEWMSFIDTDEYLVPMRVNATWSHILDEITKSSPHVHVLKLRSSRGRPREDLLELLPDQSECNPLGNPTTATDPCLTHCRNETFLRTYNCDYIKPPRPDRFARAMKQIYRPSFVLSHFVHYSTVTAHIARYYRDWPMNSTTFSRRVRDWEWGGAFLNELTQGTLVHAKSVLPYEMMHRTMQCQTGSKHSCPIGRVCPESTAFNDSIHQLNLFVDDTNQFCNCWLNEHVENYWIPQLKHALDDLSVGG
jgi:hypothetical protein